MSNHFHVLLDVPEPEAVPELTEEILLEKLPLLYPKAAVLTVKQELERAKGNPRWRREILARYQSRMGRLDVFMKELKQRFTQWYNRNNQRKGTLWEDRYKSVLVERNENALITMAAYIDLKFRCGREWSKIRKTIAGADTAKRWVAGKGRVWDWARCWRRRWTGDWTSRTRRRTGARYRMTLFDHWGRA